MVQDLSLPGIGVCVPASRTPPRNASGGWRGRWSHKASVRGGAAGVTLRGSCGLASEASPPCRPAPPLAKVQDPKVAEGPLRVPRAPPGDEPSALVSSCSHTCSPNDSHRSLLRREGETEQS